jgi:hypothetical protein
MSLTSCMEFEQPMLDRCDAPLDWRSLLDADGTVVLVLALVNDPLGTVDLRGMHFRSHLGA